MAEKTIAELTSRVEALGNIVKDLEGSLAALGKQTQSRLKALESPRESKLPAKKDPSAPAAAANRLKGGAKGARFNVTPEARDEIAASFKKK